MKRILSLPIIGLFALSSCTEVSLFVDTTALSWDTTYVESPQAPQQKMILVEEPSGVECVNCPAGASDLNKYNQTGVAAGRLVIVTIHAGDLTKPINKEGKVSKYDFRTETGLQILNNILGGDIGKPCAAFDRLPISSIVSGGVLDYRNKWSKMIQEVVDNHNTTPINLYIDSRQLSDNRFEIEVTAHYTQAVEGKQAITVYITEDDIEDYQMFPTEIKLYEFDHTFRAAVSPFSGVEILSDMPVKEAGRTFKKRFYFEINREDAQQATWKPENMHVVAFIHNADSDNKSVFQTAQKELIP